MEIGCSLREVMGHSAMLSLALLYNLIISRVVFIDFWCAAASFSPWNAVTMPFLSVVNNDYLHMYIGFYT